MLRFAIAFVFFFNDTATTEIYTLSLHVALPISCSTSSVCGPSWCGRSSSEAPRPRGSSPASTSRGRRAPRSEEHTSELQSLAYLVCRLLLEKKKHAHPISQRLNSATAHATSRRD